MFPGWRKQGHSPYKPHPWSPTNREALVSTHPGRCLILLGLCSLWMDARAQLLAHLCKRWSTLFNEMWNTRATVSSG